MTSETTTSEDLQKKINALEQEFSAKDKELQEAKDVSSRLESQCLTLLKKLTTMQNTLLLSIINNQKKQLEEKTNSYDLLQKSINEKLSKTAYGTQTNLGRKPNILDKESVSLHGID